MEQRTLGHCCPEGTDFGIPTDHRDQVDDSLTSIIFCWLQNGSVNVNPDASSSVLRAFDEFQGSKALVCVLHCCSFQLLGTSNPCSPDTLSVASVRDCAHTFNQRSGGDRTCRH